MPRALSHSWEVIGEGPQGPTFLRGSNRISLSLPAQGGRASSCPPLEVWICHVKQKVA